MKVGICVRAISLDGNSTVATSWATLLRDGGHDVTLLTPLLFPGARSHLPSGVTCLDIGQSRWESIAGLVQRLGRTFATEKFDVLFVLTGLPIPGLEQAYPLIPQKTALIPAVLGDRDHVYDPLVRSRELWNMAIVISPGLQAAVKERVPAKPTELVHLAVDAPPVTALIDRSANKSTLRLISVGRLFGRKNVQLMPPILAACLRAGVPVELTVVGDGPDRDMLERSCREHGVHDRVHFRCIPRAEELSQAFLEHDVLVWTAGQGEGLGLVLLEAQAHGCVPVATRLPGISDFAVTDGQTGLLARPDDPEDFARQIISLTDPRRRQAMGAAGATHAREQFGRGRLAGELAGILDAVHRGAYPLTGPRGAAPPFRPRLRDRVPRAFDRLLSTDRSSRIAR